MAYFLDNVPPSQDTSIYPVGATYTQYYGESTPASLFGGTWTDITSTITQGVIQIHSSGSNSNGSWIRYTDGTMLCYNAFSGLSGAWNNVSSIGSAGTTSYKQTGSITFPVAFVNPPIVTASVKEDTPTTYSFLGYVNTISATAFNQYIFNMGNTYVGTLSYYWQAIGKWSSTPVYPTTIWRRTSTATSSIASPTNIVTGIYDSGTNSNGSWIRYTDGTMMQYAQISVSVTTTALGPVYRAITPISLALSFINTSFSFSYCVECPTISVWGGSYNTVTTSSVSPFIYGASAGTGTVAIYWQAIGKWK